MIQFLKISFALLFCISLSAFNFPNKKIKNETLSWSFHSLDSSTKYEQNSKELLSPASTLKIVSMIYALDSLGADFTFKTKVHYSGEIKNGVLHGDIIIVGGSDPYLKHPQLFNMSMAVKKLGISKVEGRLIYDISSYPEHKKISNLGHGDQTYNPSFGPLNTEFNRHSLWKNKTKNYTSIIPELPIKIENSTKLKPTQKFSWKEEGSTESWKLNKSERLKRREDVPIRNAGNWSAKLFRYHLNSLGIKISTIEKGILPKGSTLIFNNKSLPLWNLISLTMEYSNNLLSETIAMRACQENKVSPLNQKTCSKDIETFLGKSSSKSPSLINASGLSTKNLVTTYSMSRFIKNNSSKNWNGQTLGSLLSISGQSGWMRNRLNTPSYNMHVFAKTGSLDFVNNIVGLVRTRSNKWYSFSIFHTKHDKRKELNLLPAKKLKQLSGAAKAWRGRSLKTADHLLQSFIDQN